MHDYDWEKYDQVVVGLSGGKDSTALMLWMHYESGCPQDKIVYEFWDTGNEDDLTYAYLHMLSVHVAPVVVRHPPLGFWKLSRSKKRFPSKRARFCTELLKSRPSENSIFLKSLLGASILKMTGKRKEEGRVGNDRGDILPLETSAVSRRYNGRIESIMYDVGHPIRSMTLDDVFSIHKRYLAVSLVTSIINNDPTMSQEKKRALSERVVTHGVPMNPLYAMGANRVGCFPCVFSSKNEIRGMVQYRPHRLNFISRNEEHSTFFGIDKTPIRFRSRKVVDKNGKTHFVPTAQDVAKWSMTGKLARQPMLDFDAGDIGSVCSIGVDCE